MQIFMTIIGILRTIIGIIMVVIGLIWLLYSPAGLLTFAYAGFRWEVFLHPWEWLMGVGGELPPNMYSFAFWIWLYTLPVLALGIFLLYKSRR